MARAEEYAQWIVDNQDKQGTPEFETVAQAYAQSKSEPTEPSPDFSAQAVGALKGAAGPLTDVAKGVASMGAGSVKDIGRMGSILYNNMTPAVVGEMLGSPIKYGKEAISSYVAGHPLMGQVLNTTPKAAVQGITGFAKNLGGGLVRGALGPESLLSLPYTAAGYEAEKIQANPTAPEYQFNPYAMSYRANNNAMPQPGIPDVSQYINNPNLANLKSVVSPPAQGLTMGQAGQMNRQQAARNFNTAGNPMPAAPSAVTMPTGGLKAPSASQDPKVMAQYIALQKLLDSQRRQPGQ